MTEEVKQLLEDYFSAASNLYGLIPVRKLLGIYNSQNDPVTEEDFEEFLERFECREGFYDIIGEDEIFDLDEPTPLLEYYLASDYLLEDFEDLIEMKSFQTMFEYYVPKKEKLLRYKDDFFYEKSLEFIDLRAFLRNLPYLTKEQADNIAGDVHLELCMMKPDEDEEDWEYLLDWAVHLGFKDKEKDNLEKFLKLCFILNDHVRKHWFCGHTASEVDF